ncbi:MAG: hypothetical protein R6X11_02695, partial [Desulfonatronovibrio sp.]
MYTQPAGLVRTIEHFSQRNLLLLLIIGAIALAMYIPVPEAFLDKFDISALLVAAIFISQGLKMDLSQASKAGS